MIELLKNLKKNFHNKMSDPYWFHKKWGIPMSDESSLMDEIASLKKRIEVLENENIETSNCLYEIQNSIEAVDNRIDILYNDLKRKLK